MCNFDKGKILTNQFTYLKGSNSVRTLKVFNRLNNRPLIFLGEVKFMNRIHRFSLEECIILQTHKGIKPSTDSYITVIFLYRPTSRKSEISN